MIQIHYIVISLSCKGDISVIVQYTIAVWNGGLSHRGSVGDSDRSYNSAIGQYKRAGRNEDLKTSPFRICSWFCSITEL